MNSRPQEYHELLLPLFESALLWAYGKLRSHGACSILHLFLHLENFAEGES